MDPIKQIMYHPLNRVRNPKKRWRTVCRNEAQGAAQARASKRQQQAPLGLWIRPTTWMTTPLDLDPDVSSLIVEALMRQGDVATIRSFALVSRACTASVAMTLQTTRDRLRQAATRVSNAERGVHIWCGRAAREEARQEWMRVAGSPFESDDENLEGRYMDHYNDDLSDHEADEIDRMESLRDAFYKRMERVGITFDRRNSLVRMAQVTWFHDNRSLLAHLSDGCELCGSTTGVRCNPFGGPVALFSCGACRRKNGVELELRPVGPRDSNYPPRPQRFVATVDACETEGNDYARALLCKHKARRKRMCTNRPHMLGTTNLGKRVHVIESNASLLACYDQSKWRMGYASWEMVLWHRLPPTLPQKFTFSAMMGVRDSDLVRDEALRDAQRRKAVRRRGAHRRSALAKMFRRHAEERANVFSVVRKGTFEGWVQAIDLCSAAHAFEVRWMFRAEQSGLNSTDWRMAAYKLLDLEERALAAAVRRCSAVAHAMRIVGGVSKAYNLNVGNVILQIVRNYPHSFLEGPVHCVNGLTSMLLHAPIQLSVLKESNGLLTMQVEYILGTPFYGRRLTVRSYFSGYTVSKILKALGQKTHGRGVTNAMVQEIARRANNTNFKGSEKWNEARQVVFGLPAVWPEWITTEAAHAKWHEVHSLEYERRIRNK